MADKETIAALLAQAVMAAQELSSPMNNVKLHEMAVETYEKILGMLTPPAPVAIPAPSAPPKPAAAPVVVTRPAPVPTPPASA